MKSFTGNFLEPLKSIKDRPYHFILWWIVANVIGLAGFWLPLVILKFTNIRPSWLFENLANIRMLASFSVIILADGIASSLGAVKTGTNIKAAGIRGVVSVIAILLVVVHVAILSATSVFSSNVKLSLRFPLVLTAIAILIASYLYCFRYSSWEKSVDDAKEEEDREVKNLSRRAEAKSADDTGIKL